jgi:hypothetical protein
MGWFCLGLFIGAILGMLILAILIVGDSRKYKGEVKK